MQTLKFKHVLRVTNTNKKFIRNVTVNDTALSDDLSVATKKWREIPGPSSLPIIGQLHHFLPGGSLYKLSPVDLFNHLRSKYGPIVRVDSLFGRPPMIFLYDAENSAKVLRGENWLPVRPIIKSLEYYRKTYVKNNTDASTGLLTENDEAWKQFRSKVNPALLQPKSIKFHNAALDEVAQDMITRMKSLRGVDNVLKCDFDTEMKLWALESIGVVTLNDRLYCFDPNLSQDSPVRKLIENINNFFTITEKAEIEFTLWKYFSTATFKKTMKMYEEVDRQKFNKRNKNSDDEKSILEKLLEIDENIAIKMAVDMLFAGVDTTSNTLIYTLYLLAKNPDKQEKLREEVISQKDQRPYLKACVKESTRLFPVVVINLRQTTKEYNLMGYKVPKDVYVTFHHQYMSSLETHYKRASEFIPERWLVGKEDPLYHGNAHPFAHSPFGFGVRSCIGRRIAELEIQTFLARIMENFKVEWFGPPLKVKQSSLVYATAPFNFTFKDI